jgi:membrane protein
MVLSTGFLLLVSLLTSAFLSGLGHFAEGYLPAWFHLLEWGNLLVDFVVVTLLFALIFRYIPDTEVEWEDVWWGAGLTAVLFAAGKFLIGLYLGSSSIASSYGAAGSLVIILIWVYYSAQILFFGAEFTQVYAHRCGSRVGASPRIASS